MQPRGAARPLSAKGPVATGHGDAARTLPAQRHHVSALFAEVRGSEWNGRRLTYESAVAERVVPEARPDRSRFRGAAARIREASGAAPAYPNGLGPPASRSVGRPRQGGQ